MITSKKDHVQDVKKMPAAGLAKARKPIAGLLLKVQQNVESLVLAFRMCGFNDQGYNRKGTIDWHVKCVSALEGDWMKYYKFKGAAFYAAAEGQETPESPLAGTLCASDRPEVILGGEAGRWARSLQKRNPRKFQELAYSVLNAKRGMVRPGKEELKKAEIAAYDKLTTPRTAWETWTVEGPSGEKETLTLSQFKEELRRTVREVLGENTYGIKERMKTYTPSTSANYTKTRSKGGMVGELLSNKQIMGALPDGCPKLTFETEAVTEEGVEVLQLVYDDTQLKEQFRKLLELCKKLATTEDMKAEFLALAESLKTRVITKGPAYTNFVLKPLQRFLWKCVRQCAAARLVGETITEEYLCQQVGSLREEEEYVSVDYSDATNEIDAWVSEEIVDEIGIVLGLDEVEVSLAKANLTQHLFENPRKRGEFVEQVNGQLMGSILSFPVLCLANLTVCRMTQERARGRAQSLAGMGACVNGDDGVLRGKHSYHYWKQIAPAMGLKPSIGKVYHSTRFLNMNSTLFNVVEDWVRPTSRVALSIGVSHSGEVNVQIQGGQQGRILFLKRVLYVNLGLVKGLKRSDTKASVADVGLPESLGKVAQWLVESSPPEAREVALRAFLNQRWKELSKTNLSWFLPENLGGLGIPRPANLLGQKNLKTDMRMAAAIYHHGKIPRRPKVTDWKTWEYIQRRLKEIPAVDSEVVLGERKPNPQELKLQGLLALEAFLSAKSLEEIYEDPNQKATQKKRQKEHTAYLRKVEKEMRRVRTFMGKVQPFSPERLPSALEPEVRLSIKLPVQQTAALAPDWSDTPYDPEADSTEW